MMGAVRENPYLVNSVQSTDNLHIPASTHSEVQINSPNSTVESLVESLLTTFTHAGRWTISSQKCGHLDMTAPHTA